MVLNETPKTILIVDDDPDIRDTVSEHLQKEKYNVITASSAVTALNLINHTPIDCLITDIAMPDMNGLEFISAIYRNTKQKKQNIKLVVLSGYTDLFEKEPIMQRADLALEKPLLMNELVLSINKLLKTR